MEIKKKWYEYKSTSRNKFVVLFIFFISFVPIPFIFSQPRVQFTQSIIPPCTYLYQIYFSLKFVCWIRCNMLCFLYGHSARTQFEFPIILIQLIFPQSSICICKWGNMSRWIIFIQEGLCCWVDKTRRPTTNRGVEYFNHASYEYFCMQMIHLHLWRWLLLCSWIVLIFKCIPLCSFFVILI